MNKLTQEALGEFLGCSKGFISQVESGLYPLPDEKLEALLDNDCGWDTSLLFPSASSQIMAEGMSAVNNSSVQVSADPALFAVIQNQAATIKDQSAQIGSLLRRLAEKDAEIRDLTKK